MKTSKLEAKPSENSNKRKKKLSPTDPYQILRHREDVYVSCSASYRNKRMEETKTRDRA